MGQIPQDGENEQNLAFYFYFFNLYCDQTAQFFQVFQTLRKRFRPLHSKNTFILVLSNLFDLEKKLFWLPKFDFWGRNRAFL